MATKKTIRGKRLHNAKKIEHKKPLSVSHADFNVVKYTNNSSPALLTK